MTWDCPRDCDFCVNKNLPVEPKLCRVEDLAGYDQVLLTGGEPMLYPIRVLDTVRRLRRQTPTEAQKIFLYTAFFTPALSGLIEFVDGVHCALHHPLSSADLRGFYGFQRLIGIRYAGLGKTFRLYIEPRIRCAVEIVPCRWERVEVKPWLKDCPMPPDEELFELLPRREK
jgi:hypothetical protein